MVNLFESYSKKDMSQVHKTVAAAVLEEIAKPLKVFGEIQHKARKATEALVRIISFLPQVCFCRLDSNMVDQKPIPRKLVTWLNDLSQLNCDFCIEHL